MKLESLIKNLEVVKIIGNTDKEISNIVIDSNSVTKNSLFICIKGRGFDGHDYIRQAEGYGAAAIVSEKETETPLTQIIVKNSRFAMSFLASEFYGHADKKMRVIGVVGTNGKTTTTHIIKRIFDKAGIKCGLIGTLGTYYDEEFLEPTLTTPDPIELHKTLSDMYSRDVKVVVMEVSAHAIKLGKVDDIAFEAGVFTNFSQDHLDFFGDMDSYRTVKESFFDKRCKFVVVNSDDEVGLNILRKRKDGVSYGIKNPADVFAIDISEESKYTDFVINLFDCIYDVRLKLLGLFNVYNTLAAATVCGLMNVKTEDIVKGIESMSRVNGRLENVYSGHYSVFIDYAHTPDGLRNALKALKETCNGSLICVFGCGGNRDREKRREMGKISGELSDFTIITSDNPRFEEPMEIISEIEKGVLEVSKNYVAIQDRTEGIKYALNYAKKGDVVLIAGKGAEKYQEILGIKHLYNDKDTVNGILGRNKS